MGVSGPKGGWGDRRDGQRGDGLLISGLKFRVPCVKKEERVIRGDFTKLGVNVEVNSYKFIYRGQT